MLQHRHLDTYQMPAFTKANACSRIDHEGDAPLMGPPPNIMKPLRPPPRFVGMPPMRSILRRETGRKWPPW